jgi:hypothetical protein
VAAEQQSPSKPSHGRLWHLSSANIPILAARLGTRVILRASARQQNTVTSSAKPVRCRERAGVVPAFRSSVELRPIKLQELNEGSGTPANAGHQPPHLAMRRALSGARTLVGVPPRLSPKGVSHPKGSASGQASWDLVCTGVTRLRLSQSRDAPPPRSSCREADTQAARERTATPPAGTALAPMTRCASAPCPSKERGLYCNWNGDGCQVMSLKKLHRSSRPRWPINSRCSR